MPHVRAVAFVAAILATRTAGLFGLCGEDGGYIEIGNRPRFLASIELTIALGQVLAATRAVRAFEAQPEKERLVARLLLDEFHRVIRRDIVDPAVRRRLFAVQEDRAVVVFALANEAGDVVESWPFALAVHVKLAAIGGVVAGCLELSTECGRVRLHRRTVADN